jgi:hypothetical protein
LVFHVKGGLEAEGIWGKGAEGDIWAQEAESDRRMEKIT